MSAQPLEQRMSRLEGAYEQVGDRLNSMDHRLERIETKVDMRFGELDTKIDVRFGMLDGRLDTRFGELDAKFDRKFDALQWRMAALIVGTWITTILTIPFHR